MFPVFQKPPSQLFQKGFLSHSKITLMEGKVLKNIDKDMVISQIGCLPSWRKVKCSIFIGFLKILYCIMFTQQIQSLFIPQTLREFSFLWQSMKVHASPNLLNIFHSLGSTAHWCTWIQQLVLDTYPDYFILYIYQDQWWKACSANINI